MPNFELEKRFRELGYKIVAGVDEVGRGAIAGPIVAAAVVFDSQQRMGKDINLIQDSKILTHKKRAELDVLIREKALDFGIGEASVAEIDKFGIGAANIMAFKRALDNLQSCNFALIDGRRFRGFEYKYACFEKGESKSISIAAASIIAKVYRDNLVSSLGDEFAEYDFANNKGYGSSKHWQALDKFGETIHHRKSFLHCLDTPQSLF